VKGYFIMQFENNSASGINDYWQKLSNGDGTYGCPNGCSTDNGNPKTLKPKVSNTAKNPGKVFVSCSKDYGGCGLFCWITETPHPKALQRKQGEKRQRQNGEGNFTRGNAAMPSNVEKLLADLSAKVDALDAKLSEALRQCPVQKTD
jgi:hypothetical protein